MRARTFFAQSWPSLIVLAISILVIMQTKSLTATRPANLHFLSPKGIQHLSFGYRDVVADVLWLRLIQDFEHCESIVGEPPSVVRELGKGDVCAPTSLGWSYRMLDAITTLAPKFEIAYQMGGTILSVLVHDGDGAKLIYEKGLVNFPHKWPLEYNFAYLQMNSFKDFRRAADLLVEAGKDGAPQWVFSLAAKMYTNVGQALFAKSVLDQMIERDPESRWTPTLKAELEKVEKTLEKAQKDGD